MHAHMPAIIYPHNYCKSVFNVILQHLITKTKIKGKVIPVLD
jgi:hypothetical protein